MPHIKARLRISGGSRDPIGRSRFGALLGATPAAYLLALFVVPLGILVAWSMQPPGIRTTLVPEWTLSSYELTLSTSTYWSLLAKTIGTAFLVALASVVLSYPIAYTLAFIAGSRRYVLLGLALLPFLTSYLLRIFAWRLLLGKSGVLNTTLEALSVVDHPVDFLLFSRVAVIVVLTYVWVPWAALPIFLRLDQLDRSLTEAAADLGATSFQTFVRVTFPLSLPGVSAAFFFVFIPTLGDFATASAVGGAEGQMFGNIIQHFLNALDFPSGAVLSLVLLVAAFLTMLLAVRTMRIRDISDVHL